MKSTVFLGVALLLAVWLSGCARERNHTKSPNPYTFTFAKAGVSLVVGDEWQSSNLDSAHPLRPPTLVSQAGRIRVLMLPPDCSDPGTVANHLRAAFEANPQAAKHTFRRQELASPQGVRIVCVSYTQLSETQGHSTELQNREYLVKNRGGRCVSINFLAQAGTDADSVHRMIQNSLTLQ
jgi:hypothetical protein